MSYMLHLEVMGTFCKKLTHLVVYIKRRKTCLVKDPGISVATIFRLWYMRWKER